MSDTTKNQRLRGGLIFLIAALLAAGALATVYEFTRQRIANNIAAERLRSLIEVLPVNGYNNEPHLDLIEVVDGELLGSPKPQAIYRARQNDEPVAAVISAVARNGYSGTIYLLVGISVAGEITGVRVTKHQETPGLGDKIEIWKSDWIINFDGLSGSEPLDTRWTLTRDAGEFDQISGATVTSRAVINAVRNAMLYFSANQTQIFSAPPQMQMQDINDGE